MARAYFTVEINSLEKSMTYKNIKACSHYEAEKTALCRYMQSGNSTYYITNIVSRRI